MASLTERMTGAMHADVKTFQEIEADPTAISQAIEPMSIRMITIVRLTP